MYAFVLTLLKLGQFPPSIRCFQPVRACVVHPHFGGDNRRRTQSAPPFIGAAIAAPPWPESIDQLRTRRAMVKHGFLVCCSLKTGRILLRRRRRPLCATNRRERVQQRTITDLTRAPRRHAR